MKIEMQVDELDEEFVKSLRQRFEFQTSELTNAIKQRMQWVKARSVRRGRVKFEAEFSKGDGESSREGRTSTEIVGLSSVKGDVDQPQIQLDEMYKVEDLEKIESKTLRGS